MNCLVYAKRAIRRGVGRLAPAAWGMRRKKSLVILTYHRVLPENHPDRTIEQPGMYVSPETLAMHLNVVKQHFEVIDLGEWINRRQSGKALPARACCITFDDGWRDNHQFAFPILKKAGMSATIFLVADFIGTEYAFWPNRVVQLLRGPRLSGHEGMPPEFESFLGRQGMRLPTTDAPLSLDEIDRIIQVCKSVPDEVVNQMLDGAAPCERGSSGQGRRLLDLSEIAEMGASGHVRFGSHGRRHARLIKGLPLLDMHEEVVGSREILRDLTKQGIDLFCYPNGDYTHDALQLVRSVYRAAVTTRPGWNNLGTDAHLLRRVSFHNDISSDEYTFLSRVSGLL